MIWTITWYSVWFGLFGLLATLSSVVVLVLVTLAGKKHGLKRYWIATAVLFCLSLTALAMARTLGPLDSPASF